MLPTPQELDTIGKRLKYARNARGLKSRELARRAGLKSESHPSLIEGGRNEVAADIVLALARALDVTMEWLTGGGETPELEPFAPIEPEPKSDEPHGSAA